LPTGFSLEETAARLQGGHRQFSPSIITSWLDEYKQYGNYRRSRAEGLKRLPASQAIWSIKLYHRHEASNTIRCIVPQSIRQAR
jgi:hypothetical protein